MKDNFNQKAPNWPEDERALKRLDMQIKSGNLEEVPTLVCPRSIPRYLVTYMNSQTRGRIRSATVVSVTNQ